MEAQCPHILILKKTTLIMFRASISPTLNAAQFQRDEMDQILTNSSWIYYHLHGAAQTRST